MTDLRSRWVAAGGTAGFMARFWRLYAIALTATVLVWFATGRLS